MTNNKPVINTQTLAPIILVFGSLVLYPLVAQAASDDQSNTPGLQDNISDLDINELTQIRVTPFDVASYLDNGYRASNAVSASRFDAPIKDLPFAIQAFTDAFIADQKPRNLFDIARYSPGVTYRSNDFNEGNANLAIRGFAVSGSKGNIQVLRDGFNGPSIFDFTNIERVEIVKGPASFLYGQVAPGGIVNVITKTPQARPSASADISYGSYDQYRLDADINTRLADKLFFRLASSYDEDMHYWEPYDAHSWNFSPSLLWQPNERVSVAVKYERYSKDESPQLMQKPGYGTQSGVIPTAADPNLAGVAVPILADNWNSMAYTDYRTSETQSLSSWIDIMLDEHWNLRTGFSQQDYEIDALATGNFGMSDNSTLLQGRRVRGQTYSNEGESYDVHAVGEYQFEHNSLRVLLGAQYVDRSFDDWAAQAPNDPLLGSDPTASPFPLWDLSDPSSWDRNTSVSRAALTENATDNSVSYVDKSIYAGTTFGFLDDRLLLLAGIRHTQTSNQLTNHLTQQVGPEFSDSKVTPQYGLLYKLNPQVSFFASYAESFVPASQLLLNPDMSTSVAVPTEGKGYDIGIKAELLGGKLSGTLTLFDIRNRNIVNDLAHTDSGGSVVIYNVQSGEQRSTGFEFDTTATLSDNWQLYFSYSYMDARITEFSGNDDATLALDPSTLDAAGQENYRNVTRFHDAPLQMSAPHLANLWTRYDFSHDPQHSLYIAAGFNLVKDQTLQPDSPPSSRQSYTLFNAKLGYSFNWQGQHMKLDLMGKNLTNEQYRPSQSTRSRPREYLLTLSTRF